MAHIAADLVKETTTTTGTGALTLGGAVSGFRAFSAVMAASDTCFYGIIGGAEWEFGVGTYNTTLTRTTVLASSNAGAAVNFSAGTKDVFITNPAIASPWSDITVTPSTDQNNYAPSGLSNAGAMYMNIGASIRLTGLTGGVPGRTLIIANTSTDYMLLLENEQTASSAANRFRLPGGYPACLMPGDFIEFRYDPALSRWRVLNWPSKGMAMGCTEFSDFDFQSPSSSGQSVGVFAGFFSGTGAGYSTSSGTADYAVNTTEKPAGLVTMGTGTTTTGRSHLGMNLRSLVWGQGPMLSVARLAVQAATDGTQTYVVRSGFVDDPNNGSVVNGAGWEYRWNGSAAEWSTIAVAASTVTRATTSMPTPDLTYIWLIVFVNAAGTRVDFFWSKDSVTFTKAPSMSTGLPSAGASVGFQVASIVKSAGTTTRLVSIDLGGKRVDYVRG